MSDRAKKVQDYPRIPSVSDSDILLIVDTSASNATCTTTAREIRNRPLASPTSDNSGALHPGSIVFDENYAYFVITNSLIKRIPLESY